MTITVEEYLEMVQEIKAEADKIYPFRGYGWDMYVQQEMQRIQENYDIIEEAAI